MKKILQTLLVASALSASPVSAEAKPHNNASSVQGSAVSLCQQNVANRVAIMVQGRGGRSTQGIIALCNGKTLEFSAPVTTGKPQADGGVWTPEGHFQAGVLEKNRRSRKYNSPMPYSIHVHKGIFIHQGKVGEGHSSHGCIRLAGNNASEMFSRVRAYKNTGKRVHIIIKNTDPTK